MAYNVLKMSNNQTRYHLFPPTPSIQDFSGKKFILSESVLKKEEQRGRPSGYLNSSHVSNETSLYLFPCPEIRTHVTTTYEGNRNVWEKSNGEHFDLIFHSRSNGENIGQFQVVKEKKFFKFPVKEKDNFR